jgi:hypothetical protein
MPAAGGLRLAHRALETHARDVGYQVDAWVDRALEHAGALLSSEVEAQGRVAAPRAHARPLRAGYSAGDEGVAEVSR